MSSIEVLMSSIEVLMSSIEVLTIRLLGRAVIFLLLHYQIYAIRFSYTTMVHVMLCQLNQIDSLGLHFKIHYHIRSIGEVVISVPKQSSTGPEERAIISHMS